MRPLNLDNSPCSPTSSNCVIWQGPNIPCIKLCAGDTISDVIFKLATELCTIMDQLKVSNYDLSCFNSTACPPVDFQGLIQFLINQICEAQGITTTTKTVASGCPDCVVTVAACFIEGTTTTMQLVDYVNLIAQRVCSIIDEISIINNQITNLDTRVTVLENAVPPSFTLPSIATGCLAPYMGSLASAPIDQVLDTLLNNDTIGYCALIQATGLPAAILSAVASQCIDGTDTSLAYSPDTMGTAYFGSWINSPFTSADAITNLWISICDIRKYLLNQSFSVVDTNTVNLTYTGNVLSAAVQDTGWVRLNGFSYIPDTNSSLPMVRRIGNVLHFKGLVMVPLINGAAPLTWNYSTGVNSYFLNTTVAPFQGLGGVLVNAQGSITFNNNGAGSCDSVIPLSVIPVGWAIDDSYINPAGWKVASRIVPITSSTSTVLTTVTSQVISPNGNLKLGMLRDLESTNVSGRGGTGSYSTSHLNAIISNVTSGALVPKYSDAGTTIYDSASSGSQPASIYFTAGTTYPFSCDANNPDQLGGFFQSLDGLTAFISPCANLLPTPNPCGR
jgi:hypothetical protein